MVPRARTPLRPPTDDAGDGEDSRVPTGIIYDGRCPLGSRCQLPSLVQVKAASKPRKARGGRDSGTLQRRKTCRDPSCLRAEGGNSGPLSGDGRRRPSRVCQQPRRQRAMVRKTIGRNAWNRAPEAPAWQGGRPYFRSGGCRCGRCCYRYLATSVRWYPPENQAVDGADMFKENVSSSIRRQFPVSNAAKLSRRFL